MRLLLDTHVLLWALLDDPRLSPDTREVVADGTHDVAVSAASVWEIAIKATLGKLRAPDDLPEAVLAADFRPLEIGMVHAALAGALPPHHADPFDRMLVAQAMAEGLTLVTRDRRLAAYDVAVLPA